MSHNFNRDPEIIQARKMFGDWIGYAWQECLAIGDRNEGIVPGTVEQIADILAPISLQKYHKPAAKTAQIFLKYASDCGWIRIEPTQIAIVNHRKYHKKRGTIEAPSEPNLSEPNHIKMQTAPTADPFSTKKAPRTLDFRLKIHADKIYLTDKKKYDRLIQWIKAAERTYPLVVVAAALERFVPFAAEVADWWPYLDRILDKEETKYNASHTQQQSDNLKKEERAWLRG